MPLIPAYKLLSSKLHRSLLKFMLLRNNSSLTLHPIKHSIKSATTDTCPQWEETELWSQAPRAALRTPTCKVSLNFKTGTAPRSAGELGGGFFIHLISPSTLQTQAQAQPPKQPVPTVSTSGDKGPFLCIFSNHSRSSSCPNDWTHTGHLPITHAQTQLTKRMPAQPATASSSSTGAA